MKFIKVKIKFCCLHLFAKILCSGLLIVQMSCSASNPFKAKPQELDMIIVGVQIPPDDAVGNAAPLYIDLSWTTLTLTRADGEEDVVFTPKDDGEIRVVGREQIIANEKMAEYEGIEFNAASIVLNPDGLIGGFYGEYDVSWSTTFAVSTEGFTINKGEDVKILVKVIWFNIIEKNFDEGTETVGLPSFTLEMSSVEH